MKQVAGIIGRPVGHSLSPFFQQAAFDALGLTAVYELWETEPETLAARLDRLRSPDCLGANVTIPYKESAAQAVDQLDGQAAAVGAINTIVNRGGRLIGFNTDGPGFVDALRESGSFEPAGRSILLIGAGGAARGVAFGLAAAGAARIAVANRTPERARGLVQDLRAVWPALNARAVALRAAVSGFDCIVNCTSLGMQGGGAEGALARDPEKATPGTLVVDIVYRPEETPFLARARRAQLPVLGGLPMLIHQGALSFRLWTDLVPPFDVMLEAARRALADSETGGGSGR